MLVEFSVTNFRSIRERQTLSMLADNELGNPTGFNAAPALSELTAIYGPNGSGKSNLISAMEFLQEFVSDSHKTQLGERIDVTPFHFDKKTKSSPSIFEIVFIHEEYLFEYGFAVDEKKVCEEWLYATPKSGEKQKPQTWFEREEAKIKVTPRYVKALKRSIDSWIENTVNRENTLFLSAAVQQGSKTLAIPFRWIDNKFNVGNTVHPLTTIEALDDESKKPNIMKFMKGLDFSFDDIAVVETEITEDNLALPDKMPEEIKQQILKDLLGKKRKNLFSLYKMADGSFTKLDFDEESQGTRNLLWIAQPIIEVLQNGDTLVVDELEKSLHPKAVQGIIALFQNKKVNTKGAQLIFTTHYTGIMNQLDRHQIWLVTKDKSLATSFTALSEFEGRADEAIEKRYLGGRYGALPNIQGLCE